MIRYIKNFLSILLIIGVCILVVMFFVKRRFVIIGFPVLYIVLGIIILATGLLVIHMLERFSEKKILMSVCSILIIIFGLFICFVAKGISSVLCTDETLYIQQITGYSGDRTVVLYEYNAIMENRGCLCIKVNDYIYKKIPDTLYRVDSGYSLSNPNSLILEYVSESKTLNIKYRMNEKSEYIEKAIPFDD